MCKCRDVVTLCRTVLSRRRRRQSRRRYARLRRLRTALLRHGRSSSWSTRRRKNLPSVYAESVRPEVPHARKHGGSNFKNYHPMQSDKEKKVEKNFNEQSQVRQLRPKLSSWHVVRLAGNLFFYPHSHFFSSRNCRSVLLLEKMRLLCKYGRMYTSHDRNRECYLYFWPEVLKGFRLWTKVSYKIITLQKKSHFANAIL
jgi:hypothetical protein